MTTMSYADMRSSPPPFLEAPISDLDAGQATRKRSYCHLDQLDSYPSSDLPCFSSDPPEASQDSYSIAPRKRQHRGPWWEHQSSPLAKQQMSPAATRRARRFQRNLDSGIYMNSDASDESLPESTPISTASPRKLVISPNRTRHPVVSSSNELAATIIEVCVQHDAEVIDLSNLNLKKMNDESLTVLSTITKTNRVIERSEGNIGDNDYQSLHPQLQVYFANNLLERLPTSIWNLEHLTVLSMRGNNIDRLPSTISNLRNLVELNVSNNKLQTLPWELTQNLSPSGRLKKLIANNNPWQNLSLEACGVISKWLWTVFATCSWALQPNSPGPDIRRWPEFALESTSPDGEIMPCTNELDLAARLRRRCLGVIESVLTTNDIDPNTQRTDIRKFPAFCVLQGDVTYYEPNGTLSRRVPWRDTTAKAEYSSAPSLFELAIRSYMDNYIAYDETSSDSNDYGLSLQVSQALGRASRQYRDEGLQTCSVCSRPYLIARTQWLEYWHFISLTTHQPPRYELKAPETVFLPMLRQGCSLRCVPEPVEGMPRMSLKTGSMNML